ncbi:coniferyl-aldehyde dehydrogenase [Limimaricola soesokkakensis]|uniref:Aldehyde dehydrogenase n=1 Tax=Limimaricola soesokkakensis TaxID=1343159 RepID=A0A1X6ZLY8_9RHOB|nr:aldehyde dehydrogenase family protein [Limimaricola soesokkakensis]PSK85882.1 coniferyl-aldehyde dehydrogenase [Limimaricola soesokkakensis]SLN55579.1 Coniferyl aldehyde dehydrogenase [Limimaricola soesokkakensis]
MTATPDPALEAALDAFGPAEPAPDRAARKAHLEALEREMRSHAEAAAEAVAGDFGARPRPETLLTEVAMVIGAAQHARRHLRRWMRPERVVLPPHLWPSTARVDRVPLGRVGIIGPWNYPVQLALVPLVAAIAGGNRAILHPSEHTPRSAALIARIVERAIPDRARVLTGGADQARALAAAPLDGLFFTGSTATGRHIMAAAAQNLVPVVLELGGKSPAILRHDADIDAAARSIMAGKLLNAGQTCVAPDYAMVPREMLDRFVAALKTATEALYPDPAGPDYAAIARASDRDRLAALLDGLDPVPLMARPPAPPRMGAVAVIDPDPDHPLMREEIFGPILPVIPYDAPHEPRDFVAARPCPLALYVYGRDLAAARSEAEAIPAGGAVINEAVLHVGVQQLPFGGAGASGLGAYHGAEGFRAFTRPRSTMIARPSLARLVRPPYGRNVERILKSLIG